MLALAPAVLAAYRARGYSDAHMKVVEDAKQRRARMAAIAPTPIKQVLALTDARAPCPPVCAPVVETDDTLEPAPQITRTLAMAGREKVKCIQFACARFYDVSRVDMLSARRTATVVKPRQVAMYLAKILTLHSMPEIGRRFGGRDHTTVLHAVRKLEALVRTDERIRDEIAQIKTALGVEA